VSWWSLKHERMKTTKGTKKNGANHEVQVAWSCVERRLRKLSDHAPRGGHNATGLAMDGVLWSLDPVSGRSQLKSV